MSLFGRAFASAGAAAATLANKYIDEEMQANRAQLLADIQRSSTLQTERELDTQRNAPERIERDRKNKAGDIASEGAAKTAAQLAELTNTDLQGAKRQVATESAKAETDALLDRKRREVTEVSPLETAEAVKRAAGVADAQGRAQAKWREPKETEASKIADKFRALEGVLGRPLTEAERLKAAGLSKGDESDEKLFKFSADVVAEGVKAGTIKVEEAPGKLQELQTEFKAQKVSSAISAGVAQARKDGKAAEALEELRGRGMKDDALARWFSPEELKGGKPAQPGKPAAGEQQEGGSLMSAALNRVRGALSSGEQTGQAIEALRQKVRSGAQLTPDERQQAIKLGLGAF